jgi:hypothetical protein
MIKCFGVFSKVIGLLGIESRYAAAQMLWPARRRIGAGSAFARTMEVGAAAKTQFAPRASRRRIAERWESSLPAPGHHPDRLRPDFYLQTRAVDGGEPVGEVEEPPRGWNPRCVHNPVGTQTNPSLCPSHVEFISANRLFASLVFRQVRRRGLATSAEPGIDSAPTSPGGVLVAAPAIGSPLTSGSPSKTVRAAAASSASPLETLFSELARGRLRSLAAVKSLE